MIDGCIILGTDRAAEVGAITADWSPDTYFWKSGNNIVLSLLIAAKPGEGALRRLVQQILNSGYGVIVPTALGLMPEILQRWGFGLGVTDFDGEAVETWTLSKGSRLPPPTGQRGPKDETSPLP